MKKLLAISFLLIMLSLSSYAQEGCDPVTDTCEICENNNIDDDGDGRADALDPKCASYYGLEFVGDDTDCSVNPPAGSNFWTFNSTQPVESSNNTVDTQSKMAIGDIDGDGIPDVVASSKFNQQIRVIATTDNQADGSSSGDVKSDFKLTGAASPLGGGGRNAYFDLELFTADIDGDGVIEIYSIAFEIDNSSKAIEEYFLLSFSYAPASLNLNWFVSLGSIRPGIPSIADFDGDGLAEVYLKNRIYAAESGALLADAGGDWLNKINAAPVAVNINTASTNLELVCGNLIYNVPNLSSRSLQTLSLWKDMNTTASPAETYYPKTFIDISEYGLTSFSSTSVADFDKDGDIDVFMTGATGSNSGQTAVWWWDPVQNGISVFEASHPDVITPGKGNKNIVETFPKGWTWGAGRVNLGDIDGDGLLEATFVAGNQLFALEDGGGTLAEAWTTPRTINDSKSGIITTTVYDFENDGQPELVYRDAYELRIIDGATGQDKPEVPAIECKSHTMSEGPIIADVNGDGATDICVPCYQATGAFDPSDGYSAQQRGSIHLYFSNSNSWLPTRKVWNQPGYFVVNISDDLTVPSPQLSQNLNFGTAPCPNGVPGPNMPLNVFLNQVPNFSASGCPVYPGPDISFVGDDPNLEPGDPDYVDPSDPNYFPAVEVIPPICGDLEITVNFNIINDGLRAITSDIPTSFWNGNPEVDAGAILLHSEVLPVINFGIGDTLSYNGIVFDGTGETFDLYVVLNDDGTSTPPFVIGGAIEECKLGNNSYKFPIVPRPFTVEFEILSTNDKCSDTAPDNGEIKAVVYEDGFETGNYGQFLFTWYAGADTLSPVIISEPAKNTLTAIPEGDYTVVVQNIALGCSSIPLDTTLVRNGSEPVIFIDPVTKRNQTACSPFNGSLTVVVDGGVTPDSIKWFKGPFLVDMGVSSDQINGLEKDDYTVRVFKDGCFSQISETIDGPIFSDAQAITTANVLDCSILNGGSVDAEAVFNTIVQPSNFYTFDWYYWIGDPLTGSLGSALPSVHGTGKVRTGLPVGLYAVVVTNDTTNCESSPPQVTEIQNLTQFPTITISEVEPNTSCDPLNPNGQLLVDIALGGVAQDPSLYTISWFKGDNTLSDPGIPMPITTTGGVNGEIVTGVGVPGIPYTALVSSALNCAVSDTLSVSQNTVIPTLTGTAVNNSICNPTLATSNYTGSITAVLTDTNGAAAGHTPADYSYTWFNITDNVAVVDPDLSTPLTLEEQDGDKFYSLVVTNNILGCSSTPLVLEIENVPDYPVISITPTPETTCTAAGTPNGALSASVDLGGGTFTTTGYTFEWYEGTDINPGTGTRTPTDGNDFNAIELDGAIGVGKTYTVRVINNASGCESSLPYNLPDVSSVPVINLSTTDNAICDVNIGFTGSVIATVTDANGTENWSDTNEYEIIWYQGIGTTGAVVTDPDLSTPLTLEAVEGNDYTLTVRNKLLGCTSLPADDLVQDRQPTINVTFTKVPSSNCAPNGTPNGSIIAFGWADINLDGIEDANEIIQTEFEFDWYDGGAGTGGTQLTNNDATVTGIQGGAGFEYSIEVLHAPSGCVETVFPVALGAAPLSPTFTFTTADDAGCIVGKSTGQVTVLIEFDKDGDGTLEDITNDPDYNFTYAWTGPNGYNSAKAVTIGDPTNVDPTDPGLENGDYTLTLTEASLGCSFTPPPATVGENEGDIIVNFTTVPSTNCSPYDPNDANGQILVTAGYDQDKNGTIDNAIPGNFTFRYFEGNGIGGTEYTGANLNDEDSDGFIDLIDVQGGGGNTYTVQVVYEPTGCPVEVVIPLTDNPLNPTFTFTTADDEGCIVGKSTGQVTVLIEFDKDGDGTLEDITNDPDYNFTYAWTGPNGYNSAKAVTIGDPTNVDPTDPGLENGDYTLTLTEASLGCSFTPPPATVGESEGDIIVNFTTIPSTNCSPYDPNDANGQILVTAGYDQDKNGTIDNAIPGNFTFRYFEGNGIGGTEYTGANLNDEDSDGFIDLIDVQGGGGNTYTVQVVYEPTGCPVEVVIPLTDNPLNPTFTFTTADDEGCIVGKSTGQVTVLIEFDKDGDGTLEDITNDPDYNFTYAWTGPNGYNSAKAVTIGDPTNVDPTNPGLENGDYTLTLTEASLGCSFTPPPATVGESEGDIIVNFTTIPSTNCSPYDPNDANGQILVTAGYDQDKNGTIDNAIPGNFTFRYFEGNGIGGTEYTGANLNDEDSDGFIDLIDVQGGGGNTYTVQVVYEPTGCPVEVVIPLTDNPLNPTFTFTTADDEGCIVGKSTGQVTVLIEFDKDGDGTLEDITNDPDYNFTYAWTGPNGYNSAKAVTIGDPTNVDPTDPGLENGDYTLTLTEASLGCSFTPPPATVGESEGDIIVNFTTIPSTNCSPYDPNDANGQILVTAGYDQDKNGTIDNAIPGNFTFRYFEGNGIGGTEYTGANLNDEDSDGFIDLIDVQGGGGNTYTVQVVYEPTGCPVEVVIPLTDNPLNPTFTFTTADDEGCIVGKSTGQVTVLIEFDKDGDGTLEDITNDPDYNFTYAWTGPNGYNSAKAVTIGDPTNVDPTDPGLENGDYTLTLTEASLGCSFTPPPATVGENEGDIIVNFTTVPSTNCSPYDPNDANGQILVTAGYDQDKNGTIDNAIPGNFTFRYFEGNGIGGTEYTGANLNDEDSDGFIDLIDVQGGGGNTYTVQVVYEPTGCPVEVVIPLTDNPLNPTFTFTTADDEGCIVGKSTGQVTVLIEFDKDGDGTLEDITNDPDYNFTYAWTGPNGYNSAKAVTIGDPTNVDPTNPGLENGDYTLTLTEASLGCSFTPPPATVGENEGDIIVNFTTVPSTNCSPYDPNDANGQILVTAGYDQDKNGTIDNAIPGNFTFRYFEGNGIGGTEYTGANLNDEDSDGFIDLIDVQGGGGNTYTVQVVYEPTGCPVEVVIPLTDNPLNPTFTFTTLDNEGCIPGSYSGQVTVLIEFDKDGDGTLEDITNDPDYNFTYAWTGPNGYNSAKAVTIGDPTNVDPTDPGLENGDYTLTLTEASLGCSFTPPPAQVDYSFKPITIYFDATKNTSCDTKGNGSLTVGIDWDLNDTEDVSDFDPANLVNPPIANYSIDWFIDDDNNAGTPPVSLNPDPSAVGGLAMNEAIELVGNAFYTVQVTDLLTGCVNTYSEFINKVINKPTIAINVTDYNSNVNCNPNLVQLEADITNQLNLDGNGDPIFTPNGDSDFIYSWYQGSDDTGTLIVSGDSHKVLFNLDGTSAASTTDLNKLTVGDYTLKVQHKASFCESDIVFEKIEEPPVLFTITPTLVTPATTCGDGTGEVYVQVSANISGYGVPPGPFTYSWHAGAPTNTIPVTYYSINTTTLTYNLPTNNVPTASFYTNPVIGFGADPGETDSGIILDPAPGAVPDGTLSGVNDGIYTVVVTDGNGCKEYITLEIPILSSQQNNVITVQDDDRCDIQNGRVNVNLVPGTGYSDPNEYNIYIFNGTNPLLTTSINPSVQGFNSAAGEYLQMAVGDVAGITFGDLTGAGPLGFNSLEPGAYTIASIPINPTLPGNPRCWSLPSVINISEQAFDPVFTADSYVPNTSCDNLTPDGQLVINISHNPSELPDPPPTTYQVTATNNDTGVDDYVSPIGQPTGLHTITGLDAVTYTVTVTSSRACSTAKQYTIDKQDIRPSVATSTKEDPTSCEPNGKAEVLTIKYQELDGTETIILPGDFGTYNFSWYLDDGNNLFEPGTDIQIALVPPAAGNSILDNTDDGYIGAGPNGSQTYWVVIENNDPARAGKDCESQGFQFILQDLSVEPSIAESAVVANTACDPQFADGVIYIDPDRNGATLPAFNPADPWDITFITMPAAYSFSGGTVPTPAALTAPSPDVNGENGVFLIDNVLDGNYTFTINDPGTVCSSEVFQIIVPKLEITPDVNISASTPQYTCDPDGTITITEIWSTVSGSITPGAVPTVVQPTNQPIAAASDATLTNYTFTWFVGDNAGTAEIVLGPAVGANVLNSGNYVVPGSGTLFGQGNYWVQMTKDGAPFGGGVTGGGGCATAMFPITIDDERIKPTYASEVVANTACDPQFADGIIYIDPDRNGATNPNYGAITNWSLNFLTMPAAYSFSGGSVPTPAALTGPTPDIAGENGIFLINNVLDGTYTFTLTDDGSNCISDVFQVVVPKLEITPDVNISASTPQYTCDPDGTITITEIWSTVSGSIVPGTPATVNQPTNQPIAAASDATLTNYTFTWFVGDNAGTAEIVLGPAVGANVLNSGNYVVPGSGTLFGQGNYWVQMTKDGAPFGGGVTGGGGCATAMFPITIDDERIKPTYASEVVANTACDPQFADGVIYIDPDRNGATNPNYGAITNWSLNFLTMPAAYDFSGGAVPTPATLTAPTADIAGENGIFLINNVLDGTYTFTLTDDGSNCISDVFQVVVPKLEITPDVNISASTPQYTCDPDGTITITEIWSTVSGSITPGAVPTVVQPTNQPIAAASDATLTNYTLTWFVGDNAGTAEIVLGPAVGANVLNSGNYVVPGSGTLFGQGNYWVQMTKDGAPFGGGVTGGGGCATAMFPITIDDERIKPTYASEVVANTACDPQFADGIIYIDPDRNGATNPNYGAITNWSLNFLTMPAAYSFSGGSVPTPATLTAPTADIAGENGIFLINNVLDGNYTFTLTDDGSNCISDVFQVVVPKLEITPDVNISATTPQYTCDPDGTITITEIWSTVSGSIVPGTPATVNQPTNQPIAAASDATLTNYTFTWFVGDNAGTAEIVLGPAVGANVLNSGNYVVPGSGTLFGQGNYWVQMTKDGAPFGGGVTGGGGCATAMFPITIDDERIKPTYASEVVANTACDPQFADGIIYIDPDRNGATNPNYGAITNWSLNFLTMPAAYSFSGGSVPTPATLTAPTADIAGENGIFLINNVLDGNYTFTLTDDGSNCISDVFQVVVPKLEITPDVNISATTPQYTCDPDGTITITEIWSTVSGSIVPGTPATVNQPTNQPIAAASDATLTNYTFTWFVGDNAGTAEIVLGPAVGANVLNSGNYVVPGSGTLFGQGNYWVQMTKDGAPFGGGVTGGGGCATAMFPITIDDERIKPTYASEVVANTACDPQFADGVIYIDPDRNGATNPNYGAITNWSLNFLTMPAAYDFSGGAVPTPATLTAPTADIAGENGIFLINNVLDGTYTFTLTDDGSNCISDVFQVVVPKLEITPDVNISATTPQYTCDPDGTITITEIWSTVSGSIVPGTPATVNQPTNQPIAAASDATLTNYTFTWFVGDNAGTAEIVLGPAVGANVLNSGNYVVPGSGTLFGQGKYWVQMTKDGAPFGGGVTGGGGCATAMFPITIDDERIKPTIFAEATANTSCDILTSDGSFYVDPDRNGATNPNYGAITNWSLNFLTMPAAYDFSGGSVPTPAALTGPTPDIAGENGIFVFNNVLDGAYTFTITDDGSNCLSDVFEVVVPKVEIYPVVDRSTVVIDPQTTCNPDGQIIVSRIESMQSGSPGPPIVAATTSPDNDMSLYEFTWFTGAVYDPLSAPVHGPVAGGNNALTDGNFLNVNTYPNIVAGTYWLVVSKLSGGGIRCDSSPEKFIITEDITYPDIDFTQKSNTACNSNVNGEITATGLTVGYPTSGASTFDWYVGTDLSTAYDPLVHGGSLQQIVAGGRESLRGVAPGNYTVVFNDANTGCTQQRTFAIEDQPAIPALSLDNAVVVHQDVCNPSGSITINASDISLVDPISGAPIAISITDFEFLWFRETMNDTLKDSNGDIITASALVAGTGVNEYPAMGAGSYFVQLVPVNPALANLGAGCYGPPVNKIVEDRSSKPVLDFTTTANSSCTTTFSTGSIGVSAEEVDGSNTDIYTFSWTYNGAAATDSSSTSNSSVITNAPDGDYTVTVTNTLTGCTYTEGRTLILDQSISEPNIISIVKFDPLNCNPTGSLTVTSVQINGQTVPIANLEFDWYINDLNTPFTDPNPATVATLEDLLPASYFVIAREINTQCESVAKEVVISADNIVFPDVIIVQDQPQSSCDNLNPTGRLSATVDNGNDDTNTNYVFTWYRGPVVDALNIINNGNASTLAGVEAGEFTVDVLNSLTGCSSTATYVVEDASEELRLQVSVATLPVTLCTSDNGVLEARVINHPDLGTFEFTWTGPNGFSAIGSQILNVSPGSYSVSAIDLSGNYCPSILGEGIIVDGTEPPVITLKENSPLTNCDITKFNGELSASVDNRIGGYDFEWFVGSTATGTVVNTTHIFSNLDVGIYTVRVTDQVTQCFSIETGEVRDSTVTPPSPDAQVIKNVEDCINPDGMVLADVGGSILGYSFNWYDGATVSNNPDNVNPAYNNLDIGDYTVTARDLKTGCISEPVTVPVLDERVYPEFDYRIIPADCQTDSDDPPNGSIELLTTGDASIRDAIWTYYNPDFMIWEDAGTGNLYDSPAGDYEVTVTTFFGCEADGQATIPTEISNYNGISANGDGQNDDFWISCIELFPNNNVKIFNRSGILVYETDGYNNLDIVFRGVGENGVYLMGDDLPDGTYFYIIDKGDGSRPKTGYLELMR